MDEFSKLKQQLNHVFHEYNLTTSKLNEMICVTPYASINIPSEIVQFQKRIANIRSILQSYKSICTPPTQNFDAKQYEQTKCEELLKDFKILKSQKRFKQQHDQLQKMINDCALYLKEQQALHTEDCIQSPTETNSMKYIKALQNVMQELNRIQEETQFNFFQYDSIDLDNETRKFYTIANETFVCDVKVNLDGTFHEVHFTEYLDQGDLMQSATANEELNKDLTNTVKFVIIFGI